MEDILPAFGAAAIIGAAAVIIVLANVWGLYFGPKIAGQKWERAAAQLGLSLEPAASRVGFWSGTNIHQRMIGERGGVPICVGIRVVVTGTGKNRRRHYYTYVEAQLPRSLELGLHVSPSNWLASALGGLIGGQDLQVGIPDLDARYRIAASIADQARALLSAPYVAEVLLGLSGRTFQPYLTDTHVKLEAQSKCLDARDLAIAADWCVDLAHRVVSARTTIGLSTLQKVMNEAWRPIAESHGLSIDYERRMMSGRVGGMHVEVCGMQDGDHYRTAFVVRFDRPLGIGLKLERQDGWGALGGLVGMQDIKVGDRAFDDRFIVKGSPEAAVREALTAEVRATLIQLQEHATSLTVEDRGLRADVGWLVNEPSWLHAAITSIARAGAVMTGTHLSSAGPYRR
jgi:hypothetical protein